MSPTRRDFLIASTGALAASAAAADTWVDRNPAEWRPRDIQAVLNRSPWVREVRLDLDPDDAKPVATDYKVLVRWESGLPVRLARKRAARGPDAYVVSINRVPLAYVGIASRKAVSKSEVAASAVAVTSLERSGKAPIRAARAEWIEADFSPRVEIGFAAPADPIRLEDREIEFVSRLGALVVRARFPLHEMVYRGNLEL